MRILLIYRAERFSPNSTQRDRAIMDAVADGLAAHPSSPTLVRMREEELEQGAELPQGISLCLHMARSEAVLRRLAGSQKVGISVINGASELLKCSRSHIDSLMRHNNIPCAPLYSEAGWWVKRGDMAAQTKDDVRFAATDDELRSITLDFRKRGVTDILTTAHVSGDLVKFYGVRRTGFFRYTYPTDQGWSKFGDEHRNGTARHTPFSEETLAREADRLAFLTGISVYGGDCIVRADGSMAIIDFNDWPSFSAFRHEAAEAIVSLAMENDK